MKQGDAANILGLSSSITPEAVKEAYREAAKRYHPDHNPAGGEMMKLINEAYAVLKDFSGDTETNESAGDYPEALNTALNAIINLTGLEIEVCGAWAWVSGCTYDHKKQLKTAGFTYASKKKRWYFRPEDWRSSSRGSYSMEEIRSRYGSSHPHRKEHQQIEEAA